MRDLAIGFVHGPAWDAYFGLSLARSVRELAFGALLPQESSAKIDLTRNLVVEAFLASPCEWLLMVDTDQTFSPSMVRTLYGKRGDHILAGYTLASDGSSAARIRGDDGRYYPIDDPGDEVVKVTVAGGFTLTSRTVFEKVQAEGYVRPWYAFTDRAGEDGEFCLRAAECGFDVLVDGAVRPGHRKVRALGNTDLPT